MSCIARQIVAGGVVVRTLTHHVGAQRGVRHVRADVERARHALERVEVLGERLPVPLDALVERGAGDVLDALHELDQLLAAVGAHRREADAAVPEECGRHAVPARRREVRVPGGLTVEVRVHVDEPGRDERTVGIELAAGESADAADLHDDAILDRDVGSSRRRAGAVDHGAAPDDEVVHQSSSALVLAERVDGAVEAEAAVALDDLAGHPLDVVERADRLRDVFSGTEATERRALLHRRQPPRLGVRRRARASASR